MSDSGSKDAAAGLAGLAAHSKDAMSGLKGTVQTENEHTLSEAAGLRARGIPGSDRVGQRTTFDRAEFCRDVRLAYRPDWKVHLRAYQPATALPVLMARLFRMVNPVPNIAPNWNLAPTQDALVVRRPTNR